MSSRKPARAPRLGPGRARHAWRGALALLVAARISSPPLAALADPSTETGGTPAPSGPAEAETAKQPAKPAASQAQPASSEAQLLRHHDKRQIDKKKRHKKKRHKRQQHVESRHARPARHRKHHRHATPQLPAQLSRTAAERTGGTLWMASPAKLHKHHPAQAPAPMLAGQAPIVGEELAETPFAGGEALSSNTPVVLPAGLSAQLAQPPAFLLPIYKQAAQRYRVPWRVLAAINSIETDYGRDLSVSSAGAVGWMQFIPSTWQMYGDGGNPYDPHDAIFAAARLLHAAGASRDLRAAIFAYNHAGWYVAAVLWRASTISTKRAHAADSHNSYALPLDARYMRELGRTDDGVDIETAPDGAAVYSMAQGVVVTVASDPGGFGPNYPVILTTSGPLAGHYIYYGHVAASLVRPGQQVLAGEPIAIVGHTGDASSLGHGHIEIGFCDASGDPLSHHGASAWTPSGEVMRSVLVALSQRFGIANS